jgi:hypothetical protein
MVWGIGTGTTFVLQLPSDVKSGWHRKLTVLRASQNLLNTMTREMDASKGKTKVFRVIHVDTRDSQWMRHKWIWNVKHVIFETEKKFIYRHILHQHWFSILYSVSNYYIAAMSRHWDRGFESYSSHLYPSASVLCCPFEGLIPGPRSHANCMHNIRIHSE